jgi:selenium metabolism protein YedF
MNKPDKQDRLDLRGLNCPEPVLKTKKLFDDQTIKGAQILVDGEINVQNLRRLAGSLQLSFSSRPQDDHFCVALSRSNSPGDISSKADETFKPQSQPPIRSSADKDAKTTTVIFINKNTFGDGDKEFSNHLLNIFLQTVLESGHVPQAILLANSGVKLLDTNASFRKVLDDFKSKGVEVLACGLCVDFYELNDAIAKEQITNMFAICEYLFAADKVICP